MGNLKTQRDWGFAKDFVKGMYMIMQHNTADDYVLATGDTNSVQDFLNYVFDYANLDPKKHVIIDQKFYRPFTPVINAIFSIISKPLSFC